jgi:hypothetical protein
MELGFRWVKLRR